MGTYGVSVFTAERTLTRREFEIRSPRENQVLIKVDCCAICTMEQRVYLGVMKYYPFAGGHELSGTVVETGDKVTQLKAGDKVAARLLTNCGECYYCRNGNENQCVISFKASTHEGLNGPGGLAEYMLLDSRSLFKMSDNVNMAHAALAEPLACCVHSIGNGRIDLGNDVVVIGVGIMGAFHIQLAKLRGARVIACEVDPDRLAVAKMAGADILVNSKEENAIEKVRECTEGRGADVVFCTTALTKLASEAVEMAGKLGRVVLYSSFHPKNPIDLDVDKIHYSERILTGSVNPNIRDFHVATRLISSGLVNPTGLISEIVPFDQLTHAFERAVDPKTYRIIVKM